MDRGIRIAIDGPAGSGKGTAARLLAARLGYVHIDTGAMYRAITLKAMREGIGPGEDEALADLAGRTELRFAGAEHGVDGAPACRLFMDGEDVSGEIRGAAVTNMVSPVSAVPGVRRILVRLQQELARDGGVVMEGRDIGSTVLPDAELKIYLDADPEERARRRCLEESRKGLRPEKEEIRRQIERRDHLDSHRAVSPLRPAPGAIVIDTTQLSIDEVVDRLLALARERGAHVL